MEIEEKSLEYKFLILPSKNSLGCHCMYFPIHPREYSRVLKQGLQDSSGYLSNSSQHFASKIPGSFSMTSQPHRPMSFSHCICNKYRKQSQSFDWSLDITPAQQSLPRTLPISLQRPVFFHPFGNVGSRYHSCAELGCGARRLILT